MFPEFRARRSRQSCARECRGIGINNCHVNGERGFVGDCQAVCQQRLKEYVGRGVAVRPAVCVGHQALWFCAGGKIGRLCDSDVEVTAHVVVTCILGNNATSDALRPVPEGVVAEVCKADAVQGKRD